MNTKDLFTLPSTPIIPAEIFTAFTEVDNHPVEEEEENLTEEEDSSEVDPNKRLILTTKVVVGNTGTYSEDSSEVTSSGMLGGVPEEVVEKVNTLIENYLSAFFKNHPVSPEKEAEIRTAFSHLLTSYAGDLETLLHEVPDNFDLKEIDIMAAVYTALHDASQNAGKAMQAMSESAKADALTAEAVGNKNIADYSEYIKKQQEQENMSWIQKLFSKISSFVMGALNIVGGLLMGFTPQGIAMLTAGICDIASQIAILIVEATVKDPEQRDKIIKGITFANLAVQVVCCVVMPGIKFLGWAAGKLAAKVGSSALSTASTALNAVSTAGNVNTALKVFRAVEVLTTTATGTTDGALQIATGNLQLQTEGKKFEWKKSGAEKDFATSRSSATTAALQKISDVLKSIVECFTDILKRATETAQVTAKNIA